MDRRNPSVPDARTYDASCPEGKAEFIVYFRQGKEGQPSDWILERTSDGGLVAFGTLPVMLDLLDKYLYSRRATWAEDVLRFRPLVWDMPFIYAGEVVPPVSIHRTYPPKDPDRKDRSEEEERRIWIEVMDHFREKPPC